MPKMRSEPHSGPWYRYPIMWLIVALPAAAVVAGTVTLVLILKHPDPEVARSAAPAATARAHTANSVVPPTD